VTGAGGGLGLGVFTWAEAVLAAFMNASNESTATVRRVIIETLSHSTFIRYRPVRIIF